MPGPFTLAQIASRFGGRVNGDPEVLIHQVGSLERAVRGQIAFLSNPRYRAALARTGASAVIVAADADQLSALPRIVCDDPYSYFARVSQLFNPRVLQAPGVHPSASVAASARLGAGVSIGPGCAVGDDVALGEDSCLYPGVVVYPGCRIGARAIIHSGAVVIGDDVEVGANTTIDRGTIDDTVIGDGVKLDNQIQIGHNCRVGAHTAMAGCVAVAGSADIGSHCTIGAGALILGHLSICDHAHVSADTVISRSIRKPGTYTGMFPADDNESWARNTAVVRHLADLMDRVRSLEKRIQDKEKGDG